MLHPGVMLQVFSNFKSHFRFIAMAFPFYLHNTQALKQHLLIFFSYCDILNRNKIDI